MGEIKRSRILVEFRGNCQQAIMVDGIADKYNTID